MTQLFSDFFSFKRKAAIELATSVLVDAGFVLDTNQRWKGKTPKGHSVEIEIPPQFPDQLPVIWRLDTSQMQVAHVSPSNKLCLAPESGTLLDTARPTDLLLDAFERADQILGANRS
jgi:hypothetical protein